MRQFLISLVAGVCGLAVLGSIALAGHGHSGGGSRPPSHGGGGYHRPPSHHRVQQPPVRPTVRPTQRDRQQPVRVNPKTTRRSGGQLSLTDRNKLQQVVDKLAARATGRLLRQALNALARGNRLSRTQAACVLKCINSSDCGLSDDECATVRTGLESCGTDDSGEDDAGGEQSGDSAQAVKQTLRYLCVRNATQETLTVYVQYRTLTDQNEYAWLPGDPKDATEAVAFTIPAGKTTYLTHDDFRINASRVRIWAKSENSNWPAYKDKDLWLVPEQDERGEHFYVAAEMGTFTFTFNP
jgi:hypothetical protein